MKIFAGSLIQFFAACSSDVVNDCIWGIHLEGPFISTVPGAKGAHDRKIYQIAGLGAFREVSESSGR
jgi:N-acetylglucosamine-6-phosphate deacetylase